MLLPVMIWRIGYKEGWIFHLEGDPSCMESSLAVFVDLSSVLIFRATNLRLFVDDTPKLTLLISSHTDRRHSLFDVEVTPSPNRAVSSISSSSSTKNNTHPE